MSKRLSKNIDYFEDYHLVAIVSHLKDYTLCYHINLSLKIDLVKFEDLSFSLSQVEENSFSWYYFEDITNKTYYCLIGNKGENGNLMPSHKTVDYFFLIKNPISSQQIKSITSSLRKIPNITAVFDFNMSQFKEMDLLLETNELHELKYVKRPTNKDRGL
jgi:hypothetical protein